jgi:hypothetical protein
VGTADARPAVARNGDIGVEDDTSTKPASARLGARHQEHVTDIMTRRWPSAVAPQYAFEMSVSFDCHDLGSRSDLDVGRFLDAANQASRHARSKTVGADEHVNGPDRAREKHRRLTRRVGGSDDDDFVVLAKLRVLHEGCAVVDAGTFELGEIGEWRLTVSGSCGDDHRASGNGRPIARSHAVRRRFAGEFRGAFCDHDGGAKLLRLCIGAFNINSMIQVSSGFRARSGIALKPIASGRHCEWRPET